MHTHVAFGMIVGVGLAYIIYTRQTEKSDTNRPIKYASIPGKKSDFSKQYLQRIKAESHPPTRINPSKPHISKTIPEIQPGEYNIDEHLERVILLKSHG